MARKSKTNDGVAVLDPIEPVVQAEPLPGQQELKIFEEQGDGHNQESQPEPEDEITVLQRHLLKCGVKLERATLEGLETQAIQWLETFAEYTLGLPEGSEIVIHWLATLLMEREEMTRRLAALQRRCDNLEEARRLASQQRVLELEIEDMAEELKEKKSKHKRNAHRLEQLVVQQDQMTMPFSEESAAVGGEAVGTGKAADPSTSAASSGDAWRKLPLATLADHGITESQIEVLRKGCSDDTLGALQDEMTKHGLHWPTHFKGIGPAKAEAIGDALTQVVTAHVTDEPPADNEAANRRDIARLDDVRAACNEILEGSGDWPQEALDFAASVAEDAGSMRFALIRTGCGATINQTRAIENWLSAINRWLDNAAVKGGV